GKYYFKETKNLEGYVENGKKYDFDVKQDLQTLKFDVINKKIRGSVEVLKVDADKQEKPLAGVEFTLFDQNNKVIGKPKVTDKDGKVSFDNIAFGKYYIKETKTIEGYNINDEKFPVDIDKDGKVVKHTVTNKVIRGNVELLKVDTENKDAKLEGAEFELRGSNDEILGKYTTDKDGKLVIKDLVFGSYKLIETKAPTGFVLDQTPKEFTISEEGKTINVTKENTKIYGDLEVTKVDTADSKTKLANAKFEVYNEKGEKVAEGVTDEKGVASFKHLVYGKYTFKEVVAPEGYFVNETVFNFEVLENGKVISKKVEDEKVPAIKTTATDKHDGKKEMHTSKKVTIQDKVEYKDLLVGKEYTVKGKLMDKSTGKPLVVDGKEVKAEATFTPKQPTGSITLDFTFDATGLEEKEVVVFEDLIKEGKVVTTHSDLEDKDQTVKFVKPDIKTTATDKADGSKELHAIKKVTIQDVVSYNNLVVGKEYVLKGKLMDKATNKPLKVNGKEVTAETKFSPREANGSVPLNFTLDASELAGKEVVVFESVEHNGFEVAVHADIKDLGQTVKFE
ncbi:VaFE repeat-containing surface-anchored protein, partial [Bacillus cereus]|uniref:VaFE repeat-containing surface-anchored protein n=1 Tax=Bacillus cereus TaxID=1396 RepID=UPI003D182652